ncbi:MAG: CehA/McbA family metallohydrolase [Phycisphaerae bacterium]|nr:CehA/McbA family metallohydrolase [Phycisphaerae bacterium]
MKLIDSHKENWMITGQPQKRLILLGTLFLAQTTLIHDGDVAFSAVPSSDSTASPRFTSEEEATSRGTELGIGGAILEGPKLAEVSTYQTWVVVYTAGRAGVKPGGGIRIALRQLNHLWSAVQNEDPQAAGYLTVQSPDNVPISLSVECGNWSKRFMGPYFAWQNIVEVIVGEAGLRLGQTLRVTYGDRAHGSPGFLVQPFDESRYMFKMYVDALGTGEYLPLTNSPAVTICAGKTHKLTVLPPSDAVAGRPIACTVRAEDRFGNPVTQYRGTISLSATDSQARLPDPYTFTEADQGVHRFENVVFNTQGCQSIFVEGGTFHDRSNPVDVTASRPSRSLLWGDLHGHTLNSDGRGTVSEYYDFAERVAALDFCAVSDHAFEIPDEMWNQSKAVTNKANKPGRFVTFNAYEWSGESNSGGDHNVYWLGDDPPIYRSITGYHPLNLQMYHGPDPKVKHVGELLSKLREHLVDKNVFCIPHRGGRAGNPKWHDPKTQRLIEIFSEHFRSEPWANEFLKEGHRIGIMASTDNHYGNPGYGYLKRGQETDVAFRPAEVGMALIAVYAPERTRKSIFTALYDRHCYATSGDRIILEFACDGHIMGSEYKTDEAPLITVRVAGTAAISRVEIKKNSSVVHTVEPNGRIAELDWKDPDFDSGQQSYYYVRVVQTNGEEAISSPVWIE